MNSTVYVLALTGQADAALEAASALYPSCEAVSLSKKELREKGWRGQLAFLRGLRGHALVFFAESITEVQDPLVCQWSGLFHRCRETVILDNTGQSLRLTRQSYFRLLPG